MTPADPGKWRAYLLGLLPAEEAATLEERYFSDDAAFEEAVLAEDDLLDEYLDGDLPEGQRRTFEERLRQRPELAARLHARRRLTHALRRRVDTGQRPRLRRRSVALALAAAAAAVFVTVRVNQERPMASRDRSAAGHAATGIAAPPASSAARPAGDPVILLLGAGGVREKSAVHTARLSAETPALRLVLPIAATQGAVGVVVEDVDGREIWKGPGRVVAEGGEPRAEASVPGSVLAAGDYIVRYHGLAGGAEEVFFRVQR